MKQISLAAAYNKTLLANIKVRTCRPVSRAQANLRTLKIDQERRGQTSHSTTYSAPNNTTEFRLSSKLLDAKFPTYAPPKP